MAPYQMELDDLQNNQPCATFGAGLVIEEYRWMFEVYCVSIFAQELRTPQPISEKRLDRKLAECAGNCLTRWRAPMDDKRTMLPPFFGSPKRPGNCIVADIMVDSVGQNQLSLVSPYDVWQDVERQEQQ
ncbi:MAG: DUF3418 domain-containing protein [Gemmatimonadota bacterium]|nr:DUF3418 domain-containing protein [Gemmatimonadota bacterium]